MKKPDVKEPEVDPTASGPDPNPKAAMIAPPFQPAPEAPPDALEMMAADIINMKASLAVLLQGRHEQQERNGIVARTSAAAWCPKCGLILQTEGPVGLKGNEASYVHSFNQSPLTGKVCELKGKRFKAPTIFLEFA